MTIHTKRVFPEGIAGLDPPRGWYGGLATFGMVLVRRWKSLAVIAVVAGALGAAMAMSKPKTYTSIAYLGPLDEVKAKSTGAIIQSSPILDPVLAKFSDFYPELGLDERRANLASRLQWTILRGSPLTSAIYTLEFRDPDPKRAQVILNAILERWLEASTPRPDTAARLHRMLEASEAQSADLSQVITELKKRPEAMFADGRGGYMPPNIVEMIKLRTETVSKTLDLNAALRAGSRDLIFGDPTLPDHPNGQNLLHYILGAMFSSVAALAFIYLCLWGAPRLLAKPSA